LILDEVHSVSSNAFQALLKHLEEPPEHAYFSLCTTDPEKVPGTIKSRCHSYALKPVPADVIRDHLIKIAEIEPEVQVTEDVIDLIAEESGGSVRQALVYLSMLRNCKTPERAREVIKRGSAGEIRLQKLSDIKATAVRWLWKDFFPLGKLTVLDGEGS